MLDFWNDACDPATAKVGNSLPEFAETFKLISSSQEEVLYPLCSVQHIFIFLHINGKCIPTFMLHFYECWIHFAHRHIRRIVFTVTCKLPHAPWWWRWEWSCPSRHGTMRVLLAADKSSSLQPLVEVNQASVAVGDWGRKASVGGECGDTSCTESERETNEPLQRRAGSSYVGFPIMALHLHNITLGGIICHMRNVSEHVIRVNGVKWWMILVKETITSALVSSYKTMRTTGF